MIGPVKTMKNDTLKVTAWYLDFYNKIQAKKYRDNIRIMQYNLVNRRTQEVVDTTEQKEKNTFGHIFI